MALRILHTSDLHGNWRLPTRYQDFDIWIDTGDHNPNISRGRPVERTFQRAWLTKNREELRRLTMPWLRRQHGPSANRWYPPKRNQPPSSGSIARELAGWLDGRPMISVQGNHDYTSLTEALRQAGADAHDVGADGPVQIGGLTFAGLREVPYIGGEWAGEIHNFRPVVDQVMAADPNVLLTHSPPMGILDHVGPGVGHIGIAYLTAYLTYKPHNVKLVLMGHVHENGGKTAKELGILFSNAARRARIIEVPK